MSYTIEPDKMVGRLHLTKLPDGAEVSTIDLEERDKDGAAGAMSALLDGLLGRDGRYETAVYHADEGWQVVGITDNVAEVEAQHRRVVENLLDGVMLPEQLPPIFRALGG